jgi:tetratricopeptide (TPR) repeat protein
MARNTHSRLNIYRSDSYILNVESYKIIFTNYAYVLEVTVMTGNELLQEAKTLFATGHPKESIQLFTKAEEQGGNPVTTYMSRGAAYLTIGELDKSLDDFNRLLEIDADNERAFYYRGIVHLRKGNFHKALSDLSTSIVLNHERGAAFLARGLAYAELDLIDASLRDLKTAIAFSNKEVEGLANLFGESRTLFDKSMALLEGERGPWSVVMNEDEVNKLKKWIEG